MKKRFKKVYIEIINTCNLSCYFCSEVKREKKILSVNDFRYVLNQVKEFSDYVYLHVKGEPLLHPELDLLLSATDEENIQVNITTNGTLLKENQEIISKHMSIRQVNISLQALVNLSLSERNKYLDTIIDIIKDKNRQYFLSLRLWIYNENLNKYIIDYLSEGLGLLINTNNEKICRNTYLSIDEEFEWPSINSNIISDTGRCLGTKDQIAILVNGDVVPCCLDCNGEIVFGNIYNKELKEIIHSNRFVNMNEGFLNNKVNEELCKRCSYRKRFSKEKS